MSDLEITAEFHVEELVPAVELAHAMTAVTLGARTDLGRTRENNEDKYDWLEPEDRSLLEARGKIFAVSDGMGGHEAGQIAAEMALKTVLRTYYERRSGPPDVALGDAIRTANTLVCETGNRIPGRQGMGCTLTSIALLGDRAVIGHIGDSRLYRQRSGCMDLLTQDHSWVAEQIRAGRLNESEAARSPYRNVITRSIGAAPDAEPDVFVLTVERGDRYLLCSDGLTGVVTDAEIAEILGSQPPSQAAWSLVDLANDRGGPDNITCFVVRVDAIHSWDDTDSSRSQETGAATSLDVTDGNSSDATPRARTGWLSRRLR